MTNQTRSPATVSSRILVIRNRYIGDTVLAIPFLRNLRRHFPESVIDVLVEPGAGEVLADCPYKDELLVWHRPARVGDVVPGSLANILATAPWLRQRRYDRVYILKRSLSTGLLAWLARIPHRVGVAKDGRGLLLTRRVPFRKGVHEVELGLDLLRADGIEVDDGHNENWVAEVCGRKVDGLLATVPAARPRVFVAPQSMDDRKQWPLDRMAAVVRWLIEDRGCEAFLCGAPRDIPTHDQLRANLDAGVAAHLHDFTPILSLRETLALMSRMDACVGVDTGLPHVAASFGLPVAVLHGHTDPRQWRPWKTASAIVQPADGTRLMAGITVDQVTDAIDRLMGEAGVVQKARRRGMRTIDLRAGRYRYEVVESAGAVAATPTESPAVMVGH